MNKGIQKWKFIKFLWGLFWIKIKPQTHVSVCVYLYTSLFASIHLFISTGGMSCHCELLKHLLSFYVKCRIERHRRYTQQGTRLLTHISHHLCSCPSVMAVSMEWWEQQSGLSVPGTYCISRKARHPFKETGGCTNLFMNGNQKMFCWLKHFPHVPLNYQVLEPQGHPPNCLSWGSSF